MVAEMIKLRNMLQKAYIPYEVRDNGTMLVMLDIDGWEIDDCTCDKNSRGHEKGLLETGKLNGCRGYETAEQVFNGWVKMYDNWRG